MQLIPWQKEFSVSIPSIDIQHQGLLELINQLHEDILLKKEATSLMVIFDGLLNYTQTHFRYEEKLFHEHNYPASKQHIQEHQHLAKKMLSLKDAYLANNDNISIELINLLKEWWNHHILNSDQQYSTFLKELGVK